jgi:hypothetical protein
MTMVTMLVAASRWRDSGGVVGQCLASSVGVTVALKCDKAMQRRQQCCCVVGRHRVLLYGGASTNARIQG